MGENVYTIITIHANCACVSQAPECLDAHEMLKVFQSNSFENPIMVSSIFRKEKVRAALGKRKRRVFTC